MKNDYEEFKRKVLGQPISLLTQDNLHTLELHCEKQVKREVGQRVREHEIVLELLDRYRQQQEEIRQSNKIIDKRNQEKLELAKMLLKKDKIINEMINLIYEVATSTPGTTFYYLRKMGFDDSKCDEKKCKLKNCRKCIEQYFEKKEENQNDN